jgi:UDP-glucose 4-epimerase
MRFLITGGAGFIGSHLSERLILEGHRVTVLDDLSTGSLDNLAALAGHPHFEFVNGSVLSRSLVRRLVATSDRVIHLAAAVGVRRILQDPLSSLKINIDGCDNVLSACAEAGRGVVIASTSEVYGKNEAESLCENADSILGPASIERWSYATAKKLDEFLALAYHASYGIPVIVTRFFNIVGPRQSARYGMVLPAFVRSALAGDPIRVFGDGGQTRNFTYVDDCIDALSRLLDDPAANGKVFNIGGSEEVSMRGLAERVRAAADSSSCIEMVSYETAYPEGSFEDMRRRVPCICLIRGLTGWVPTTSLDSIIRKTIEYEKNRQESNALPSLLSVVLEHRVLESSDLLQ